MTGLVSVARCAGGPRYNRVMITGCHAQVDMVLECGQALLFQSSGLGLGP